MEHPDYLMAKRYSDIMKTMWFTFFYGTAIPIGIICSWTGLVLYYWTDKYNLLRRRTVKESISEELSMAMINYLEYIILFSSFGEMTFEINFFGGITVWNVVLLIVAIVYLFILPVDKINRWIFKMEAQEESVDYRDGRFDF